MTQNERERLATLETKVDIMVAQQNEQAKLLREVRDAIVSARGAKWAVVSLVSVSGVVGGIVSQFLPK